MMRNSTSNWDDIGVVLTSRSLPTDLVETTNSTAPCILPNYPSPLALRGTALTYQPERGVPLSTHLILGSNNNSSGNGDGTYQSRYLWYNPTIGSLAFGQEESGRWSSVAPYSLIAGLGNEAGLGSSFVSGTYNQILSTAPSPSTEIPPSCAILGGSENKLTDCLDSVITACTNIEMRNCENVTAIAVQGPVNIDNKRELLITTNLEVIRDVTIGGTLRIQGPIISPPPKTLNSNGAIPVDSTLIYVHAANESIHLELPLIQEYRTLIIKDLGLTQPSSFDVYIHAPADVTIETYRNDGMLALSRGGGYVINSAGGSVTLSYLPNINHWSLVQQLIGRPR